MMFDWLKKNLTTVYIIVAVITIIAPWLLTRGWFGIDFTETRQVGDTIGGLTAPFLNLLSVTLLYLTLKEQMKINERQEDLNREQAFNRNEDLKLQVLFRKEEVMQDKLSKLTLIISNGSDYSDINSIYAFHALCEKHEWNKSIKNICNLTEFSTQIYVLLSLYHFFAVFILHNRISIETKVVLHLLAYSNLSHILSAAKDISKVNRDDDDGILESIRDVEQAWDQLRSEINNAK